MQPTISWPPTAVAYKIICISAELPNDSLYYKFSYHINLDFKRAEKGSNTGYKNKHDV